ncbi:hypothetical protein EKK58_10735 [Candidatus Dependentiae bacterium]|nr:MAG: hypothetical protein EKK58_10735 [Candidatus Dependentiae bacterium]
MSINKMPVICFDLDNTIIDSCTIWQRNALIFGQAFPFQLPGLWALYTQQAKDKYGIFRFKLTVNNRPELAPSGAGLSLVCYGLYGKKGRQLQQVIPAMLDIHCAYTDLLPGAALLLHYLVHTKKYTIVYATNKDYLTYTITKKKIDRRHNNIFGNAPTFVLLAHPTKDFLDARLIVDQAMPVSFQRMVQQIKNAQEGNTIFFAPEEQKKPENRYYELLKKIIKTKIPNHGTILFFDDQKYNVHAAKHNGIEKSYHVPNGSQIVAIIKALEAENLLSPEVDAKLYQSLANVFK